MDIKIHGVCLSFFFILFSFTSSGQKVFNTDIVFPKELNTQKVKIFYDNGKELKKIKGPFTNSEIHVIDSLYSKFAAISCMYYETYTHSSFGVSFFVSDESSKILINERKDSTENPFSDYTLTNAYDITKTEAYNKMKLFTTKEWTEYSKFNNKYGQEIESNDSLKLINKKKYIKFLKKELDFIESNGDQYYSFWFFKNQLLNENDFLSPDTLLRVYNLSFPNNFKNSFEGKLIVSILKGRINIANKNYAPYFKSIDVNNNVIDLENFKGKYVLLDFWASWCGPCIKERATLRNLNHEYQKKLVLISISTEKDRKAFNSAIKKYKMNWINIFGDIEIEKIFLKNSEIPQLYLIDPSGKVIYSREEEKDYSLQKLNSLIKDSEQNL